MKPSKSAKWGVRYYLRKRIQEEQEKVVIALNTGDSKGYEKSVLALKRLREQLGENDAL